MIKIRNVLFNVWMMIGTLALSFSLVTLGEKVFQISKYEHMSFGEREYMRPEWLNDHWQRYYDEVDVYVIEDPVKSEGFACYIDYRNDIYINSYADSRVGRLRDGKHCMAHEVGHYIDRRNGFPSETVEFADAVDLAARVDWSIAHWPCLYENDCLEGGWGGYGEIYAELFARNSIADIPAVLWDWYLPYYR